MKQHKIFNILDLDILKSNISRWAKDYSFIQKIELFGPADHDKHARIMQGEDYVWEYKFALITTVTLTIGPLEKHVWQFKNEMGDSPVFWPHKAIFLESYKNLADRNIYDWRLENIYQEDHHANDIINFWADRQGSVVLYYSCDDKTKLIEKHTQILIEFCKNIKEESGQYPTQPQMKEKPISNHQRQKSCDRFFNGC